MVTRTGWPLLLPVVCTALSGCKAIMGTAGFPTLLQTRGPATSVPRPAVVFEGQPRLGAVIQAGDSADVRRMAVSRRIRRATTELMPEFVALVESTPSTLTAWNWDSEVGFKTFDIQQN